MLFAQQDNRPLVQFTLAPLFEDYGIPLAVMGVFVVFLALVLVVAFIALLPRLLKQPSPVSAPHLSHILAEAEDELSEEMMVVIAAAVAETIRQPHRIVRIRGLAHENLGWSLEGRMQHHHSHQLPHRDRR